MNIKFNPGAIGALLSLCLCARAIADPIRPALPGDVPINKEVTGGGHLIVTFRLENGEELPLLLDTGSPVTLLDKSLEPRLGKHLRTVTTSSLTSNNRANVYAAPKLYLGDTPLITGSNVLIHTFKRSPANTNSPIMGILGLDCLRNYCVQLDFDAGKLRFLDPDHLEVAGLGKAFPLTYKMNHPIIHHESLLGESTNLLIDTGCNIDGLTRKGTIPGSAVLLPECVWDGNTYTNVIIASVGRLGILGGDMSVLGLSFLARHLVTLNFPGKMMYLKQTSIGALDVSMKRSKMGAPMLLLDNLRRESRLPGLPSNNRDPAYLESDSKFTRAPADAKGSDYLKPVATGGPKSETIGIHSTSDSSRYHYVIGRASESVPWTLQRAWRTDQAGRTLEKYPLH